MPKRSSLRRRRSTAESQGGESLLCAPGRCFNIDWNNKVRIDHPPDSGYPGISLRQLERSDIDDWYAYLMLPNVFGPTSWNLSSRDDLMPLLDELGSGSAVSARRLAIVSDATGELVGTIGFHTVSELNRTAEIAYDLRPSNWGRGIASAVCERVAAWSFEEYGFVRIQGTVLQGNSRSARVLEHCRFRYEGLLRSYRMVRGVPGDFAVYSRLATD
jgi:[ribosomal protein S5]-alanine N-acetyltransferase